MFVPRANPLYGSMCRYADVCKHKPLKLLVQSSTYGRAGPRSRPGPDPRHFGRLTRGPERTSPSTSATPIRGLRGSPDHRRSQEGERCGLRVDPRSILSADKARDRATDALRRRIAQEHSAVLGPRLAPLRFASTGQAALFPVGAALTAPTEISPTISI